MGTCCGYHLAAKVRDYAKNAQNGAVTVSVIENPDISKCDCVIGGSATGDIVVYCKSPAEFSVSYFPK